MRNFGADATETTDIHELLAHLRHAREVDTLSDHDPGCEPVDGTFDWAKDLVTVTHRTVSVCCTNLLNVCKQQDFRTDLRFLRSVLQHGDMLMVISRWTPRDKWISG
jgi:hypothetical protein